MSSKSALNGLNSCKCCPYGFHIDTDFVNYCDALLTALYGSKRLSKTLECRTTNSLRRKINSAFSNLNSSATQMAATDAFLSYCDYNYNNISKYNYNYDNNNFKNNKNVHMKNHSNDIIEESLVVDSTLGEVVEEFEEAWLESRNRISMNSDTEPIRLIPESPPPSPAPSSCTSSNISRAVLSQIRDQMALSLTRVKELENQVKDIPNLRQKVMVLREEKKKLMKRLEGDSDDGSVNDEALVMSRCRQLEKSGLITPPVMRRKLLLKTESDTSEDEFGDIWVRPSPPPSKLVSSKNIRLEVLNDKTDGSNQTSNRNLDVISVSTNTETDVKALSTDRSTDTKSKHSTEQPLTVDILNSVSIKPESQLPMSTKPSMRSIGISTSLAPSLPRKSVATETDLKLKDTIDLRELDAKKPALVSWGTDPMRVDVIHAQCQASAKCVDASTKTEQTHSREIGVSCNTALGIISRNTQTERTLFTNKIVQVSQDCPKCELKQTETVGVGDNYVYGPVRYDKCVDTYKERPNSLDLLSASPVSRASSAQSIRLCDKCNDAITSVAKDFVIGPSDQALSPLLQSRIPRPIQSTASLDRGLIKDRIIEENRNEISIYRNKSSLSAGSSPIKRSAPIKIKDFSSKTPEEIKLIDDVFKMSGISESDESDDESSSSDEGTYEVETGAVAKPVTRKRVEPTKEIKAALKVLNDNLIKPEKANKSALLKSLSIIEKEWFKVAANKESNPHVVEDYIDCFETFSKHLLNRVVNLDDFSGNTAIHYAISHCNFDIVSVLLDSKVCDVNKTNKAGYTATMLVSLAKVENETQKAVIRRLFQLGDVNIKAKQNEQTALMLAASHGQFFTSKILMECGAAINVQDNDGSTALMCAAEHGHTDVVRLLLSHPDCDPTLLDNDGSTALKIAMANSHNNIGLMLYASTSMLSRGSSPYASLRRTQSKAIAASLRRTGSFNIGHSRSTPHTFQLAPSPPPRSRHSSVSSKASLKK